MKGDFTRSTFQKNKHYRKVNMQQGRVQIDADWNEQNDIQSHHEQSFLLDLIGKSGTQRENDGFKILENARFVWTVLEDESTTVNRTNASKLREFLRQNFGLSWIVGDLPFKQDGPDSYVLSTNTHKATLKRDLNSKSASLLLEDDTNPSYVFYYDSNVAGGTIYTKGFIISSAGDGPGRYYVDGILCENEYPVEVSRQPDLQALDIRFFLFDLPLGNALSDSAKQSIAWFIAEMYPKSMGGKLKVEKQGNIITISDEENNNNKVSLQVSDATVSLAPSPTADTNVTLIVENSRIYYSVPNPSLPKNPGIYLAYLDVGDRHVTQLEDPYIREAALGGPDTATRTKTSWQVKLVKLSEIDHDHPFPTNQCKLWEPVILDILKKTTTGKLRVRVKPSEMPQDKCSIYETAGYQRLENQLYRVEVHKSGKLGEATFKWSRENGVVVSKILDFSTGPADSAIVVETISKDENLEFKNDSWIEITDELHESLGIPGTIAKVAKIDGNSISFALDSIIGTPITKDNFGHNPKARRWESTPDGPLLTPDSSSGFIKLESGIEVELANDPNENDIYFHSGDYWLVPARTKSGEVEWPRVGDKPEDDSIFMPPAGVAHHYAPLAILELKKDTGPFGNIKDVRNIFFSLTEMVQFHSAGGDGQEGLPNSKLPAPLQVAVKLGGAGLSDLQMQGITVKFTVISGGGSLTKTIEGKEIATTPANAVEVECIPNITSGKANLTPPDTNFEYFAGVADCIWQLGGSDQQQQQQVKAELLICGEPVVDVSPIHFNATLFHEATSQNFALTGIINIKISGSAGEYVISKIRHIPEGQHRETPPAIILGLADANEDARVAFMEDYTGLTAMINSGFRKNHLLFKAINIDEQLFSISVQYDPQGDVLREFRLRWWAIPSRDWGGGEVNVTIEEDEPPGFGMGGILINSVQ